MKSMDGILAKMVVRQATRLKIVKAANAGRINSSFKSFNPMNHARELEEVIGVGSVRGDAY